MFFVGTRLIPWLLERIALTRSRELFILAILAITLGIAMGASELFGVSLALGAFVAGAIISQSRLSHQVGADVFAFREIFSVLFFVSVGMLVNPLFLWQNLGHVVWLTLLVVVGKFIIVLLMGLLFPRPARTFLVIAVGLSQVGEFSFILGQAGVALGLLHPDAVLAHPGRRAHLDHAQPVHVPAAARTGEAPAKSSPFLEAVGILRQAAAGGRRAEALRTTW